VQRKQSCSLIWPIRIADIYIDDIWSKRCYFDSKIKLLSWNTKQMSLMDKFVVKTPAVSSTKKTKSHLPPNLTAKDRARKYPFHVDDRLMFCSSCGNCIVMIDHLWKSVVDKHLEPFYPNLRIHCRCLIIVPLCSKCLWRSPKDIFFFWNLAKQA
jgi:hypothetical protein